MKQSTIIEVDGNSGSDFVRFVYRPCTAFWAGNLTIVQRVSAVNPKDIAITIVTFESKCMDDLTVSDERHQGMK
jgi:hypothetical protein